MFTVTETKILGVTHVAFNCHLLTNPLDHGDAIGQHDSGVQILADVYVTLHDAWIFTTTGTCCGATRWILQSILGAFYRDQTFQFLEDIYRGVQVANLPGQKNRQGLYKQLECCRSQRRRRWVATSARLACPRYRCCCCPAWPPVDSNDGFCSAGLS